MKIIMLSLLLVVPCFLAETVILSDFEESVFSPIQAEDDAQILGNFFRGMEDAQFKEFLTLNDQSAWMNNITHYRLIPGGFPSGVDYHFDGLATVLSFRFLEGKLSYNSKRFSSELTEHFSRCIFLGTGSGPTLGTEACLKNPGVNLLPIDSQLWLTIDTVFWGRVDPDTLEAIDSDVKVESTVLNAHPACDPNTKECFVQHPCDHHLSPLTNQACFSKLIPQASINGKDENMLTVEYSRVTLPQNRLIQHSHSPCITDNYLISKLDSFESRVALQDAGLLKFLRQKEDNLWMVMDRFTNTSKLFTSEISFVNNHFWNCIEKNIDGENVIIVDTVAATHDYLDSYFKQQLKKGTAWKKMFQKPQRCLIPIHQDSAQPVIACSNLLENSDIIFDYPTFNPLFKMNPEYQWFYAISPQSEESRWFDSLLKISTKDGVVVSQWSAPGIYLSEADFIPRNSDEEDNGVLVSILFNSTSDESLLALFEAKNLDLLDIYPLRQVVPFHAHGISCISGECFPNP